MRIIHSYKTEHRIANFNTVCFTGFKRMYSYQGYLISPYVERIIDHIKGI